MNQHYHDRYHRFILSRARRGILEGVYTERHHIHPRCLGGGDEASNIVTLTGREHFIAHRLLRRAYPDSHGLQFAFFSMCNSRKYDYRVDERRSRDYEKARVLHAEKASDNMQDVVTLLDLTTGKRVRITKEQQLAEPDRYAGIMLGLVATRRIEDGQMVMVTPEEAKDTSKYQHFNAGRKRGHGTYITPKGRFENRPEVMAAHGFKSHTAVDNRCRILNAKVITRHSLQAVLDMTPEEKAAHVGKTWAEMGWGFEPK